MELTEEMALKLIKIFDEPKNKQFMPNPNSQFVKVGEGIMENS